MIHVEVTQHDIDVAVGLLAFSYMKRCHVCPIAQAFKRLFPDKQIEVNPRGVVIDKLVGLFPPEVTRRITMFDVDGGMQPFSFDIELNP